MPYRQSEHHLDWIPLSSNKKKTSYSTDAPGAPIIPPVNNA